jgi:hypothetical protein
MTTEMTLYRCYWPPAYDYLKTLGVTDFVSQSYDLLMTLEVGLEHAVNLAALLPAGAVVGIVPLEQPLETQDIDDLLFFPSSVRLARLNKN